jgi:sirohydrochlorin ferrochelatase
VDERTDQFAEVRAAGDAARVPRYDRAVIGYVIVDHGSRVASANEDFELLVRELAKARGWSIVEPAHMELASPTIAEAFARAVAAGADEIVVHPYFLALGRHAREDVPAQCERAAEPWPALRWSITAPTGSSPRVFDAIGERIDAARHAPQSSVLTPKRFK